MRLPIWLISIMGAGGSSAGCGSPPAPEIPVEAQAEAQPEPAVEPALDGAPPSAPTPAASPVRPVFANCVLHAGTVDAKTRRQRLPGGAPGPITQEGACSYNAECVARQGESSPGDGLVDMRCSGGECTCRLEPLAPPSPPFELQFAAICTSAQQARQLLLERCLEGMGVAAEP
jgi:hypothetical protein